MGLEPRRAGVADIPELLRLRDVMFESVGGAGTGAWRAATAAFLEEALPGDGCAAFVVDHPDEPGRLIACGVVTVTRRLGSPRTPTGRFAHIQSMATDPVFRRRGLGRRVLAALIHWCAEHDITSIDLHASVMGEPLYRSVGFHEGAQPELRLP